MLRLAVIAVGFALAPGCRYSLEKDPIPTDAALSAACQSATTHSDLTFLESTVFKASCVFSGCHNGAQTDAGHLDLREGMTFATAVNVDAKVQTSPQFKLVVPNEPAQSYLMVMIGQIEPADASPPISPPPDSIGYMPQNSGGTFICKEKRDAIERWIMAGALDN